MNKNKNTLLAALILFIILIIFMAIRLFTPEDAWICNRDQWLKHGNPTAEMPKENCK